MNTKLRQQRSDEGFTLIELLVVIVILGILSAVVVFSVSGISDKGTQSACKSDVKTVEVAQEAYRAKNPAYAASPAALVTAGLLKSVPSATAYTIATSTSGAVTATPACTTL